MIVHVLRRARLPTGSVVVATDSEPIAACVEDKAGGRAVMTRAIMSSGSDRIFEALAAADPEGRCQDHRQPAGRPADHCRRRHTRRHRAARRSRRRYRQRLLRRSCGGERVNPNVVKVLARR